MNDVFRVARAAFSIETPFAIPDGAETVRLCRATDGATARLDTAVAAYHDGEALVLVFTAEDDAIVATHLRHDAPLYEEDVFEVFLSPRDAARYFEIEVNPLGTLFDAELHSPDGVRATMTTDLSWRCDGIVAAIEKQYDGSLPCRTTAMLRIPFASLGGAPLQGERWRGNLFRIDRHRAGDDFLAWRPTMKTPADFHVAAAFGEFLFV